MQKFIREVWPDVLAEFQNRCQNSLEVQTAYREGTPVPPVLLQEGLTVHAGHHDPIPFMLYEIFVQECYTCGGFYSPAPEHTVLDVGANVGLFTLWLSARAPGIRVHCFEPAADTRERLMQNVIANCPADAVAVHPFAIFNDSTSKELKEGRSTGECSFYVSHNVREDAALEKVDCITLATALQFADADRIDLLKIDAEGAELEILASVGQSTMDRIERISLEYHEAIRPGSLAKILGVLEARGFTTFVETDARYGEDFGIGIVKASRS